jgi:small subunit ribosomal protein S19
MIIIPEFVGKQFMVHNGKEWIKVDVRAEMVGHRLGEYSRTTKYVTHSAPGVGATRSSKFLPLK